MASAVRCAALLTALRCAAAAQCPSGSCDTVSQDHVLLQMRPKLASKGPMVLTDAPTGTCCFHATNAADPCGSCLATTQEGSFCGQTEEHCKSCSPLAVWCPSGGAVAAPPVDASPTKTPSEAQPTTTKPAEAAPTTTAPTPAWTQPPKGEPGWKTGTWTTGYWDCCKPSCSWGKKGHVNKPVLACDVDTGEKLFDSNVQSVCNGGKAASCSDNKPFVVKRRLSMGFAAAAVSGSAGLTGDENCGQCYEVVFTKERHSWGGGAHPDLVGASMVVQVTNIGFDVTGDHSFDIQIPGAGQGIFTNGCAAQFEGYQSADFDCGVNFGGCSEKSGCSRLPEDLRSGCEWRHAWYHWLESAGTTNNPWVKFRRVRCPQHLTNISWSTPLDDHLFPELDIEAYV